MRNDSVSVPQSEQAVGRYLEPGPRYEGAERVAQIRSYAEFSVDSVKNSNGVWIEGEQVFTRAPRPELTVWYGSMPESNGKTNWTAILHRKDGSPFDGIAIDQSEYPERTRYEADNMRYLIGELEEEPDSLAYDADKHSGYVEPAGALHKEAQTVETPERMTYAKAEQLSDHPDTYMDAYDAGLEAGLLANKLVNVDQMYRDMRYHKRLAKHCGGQRNNARKECATLRAHIGELHGLLAELQNARPLLLYGAPWIERIAEVLARQTNTAPD